MLTSPQNCHFLEKMDLEDCVTITDATLIALAQNCPRLETLVSGPHPAFVGVGTPERVILTYIGTVSVDVHC